MRYTVVGLYPDTHPAETWAGSSFVEFADGYGPTPGQRVQQAIRNACALAEDREPENVIAVFEGEHLDVLADAGEGNGT